MSRFDPSNIYSFDLVIMCSFDHLIMSCFEHVITASGSGNVCLALARYWTVPAQQPGLSRAKFLIPPECTDNINLLQMNFRSEYLP